MIGFLLVMAATFMFMLLGYTLLATPFIIFMNILILLALAGLGFMAIAGLIWEFWFQKPAKTLIANRNAAGYELAVDDLGYGELTATKQYMPEGLVKWRFGWALLPRPIMKLDIIQKLLGKRRGRPPKDPEKAQKLEEQHKQREEQLAEIEHQQNELAEQIALKKCILKGTGRPFWLQYIGLAANFNPYVLVPSEAKQDNPHDYFKQFRSYLAGADVAPSVREELAKKLTELESHVDHIRVVLDPRRFKEIHPKMYTQSQVDDHGRIHFNLGRLSVSGLPVKTIVMILLIGAVVIGGLAAVYFLFLKPQQPQQVAGLISHIHRMLRGL